MSSLPKYHFVMVYVQAKLGQVDVLQSSNSSFCADFMPITIHYEEQSAANSLPVQTQH